MLFKNRNDIIRISDNFYFIQAPRDARTPYCNCFLLTGDKTVLIDTGIGEDMLKEIDRHIHIDALIISHSHADHFWSWHVLEDRYIFLPEETPESVKDLNLLGRRFTGTEEDGAHWANIISMFLGLRPLREPDMRFCDGYFFDIGRDIRLEAIYARGHSDDHYCFFEHNSGILITTDIDFTSFGPWYGNPEGNIKLFKESIKKVMALPYKVICSSHKHIIRGDASEEFESYLKSFDRQKMEVLELCGRPKSLDEMIVASPFYNNKLFDKKIQYSFERAMISKNLEILIEENLVKEAHGKYVRIDK